MVSGKNPIVVRTREELLKLDVTKHDAIFGIQLIAISTDYYLLCENDFHRKQHLLVHVGLLQLIKIFKKLK